LSGPRGYRSIPKGAFVPGGWYGYLVKLRRQLRQPRGPRRREEEEEEEEEEFFNHYKNDLERHAHTRGGGEKFNRRSRSTPKEEEEKVEERSLI